MVWELSQTPWWLSGSTLTAALPYFGTVIAAALGYFAARYTAAAPLQSAMNDAFRSLMEELQTERAQLIVRVSDRDKRIVELEAEVLRQRGVIDSKIQRENSLVSFIKRSGLELPNPKGETI